MSFRISRARISIFPTILLGLSALASGADENESLPRRDRIPERYPALYQKFAGVKGRREWADNGLDMKFVWCPQGSFAMGAIQPVDGKLVNENLVNENQAIEDLERQMLLRARRNRAIAESPADLDDEDVGNERGVSDVDAEKKRETRVFLLYGFWLGQYEVTRKEWKQIMGTEPWEGRKVVVKEDDYPTTYISWNGAMEFCRKLTVQERDARRLPQGWEYTLPTEAQWERACRAGTKTRFSFGDDDARLGDYAWFGANTAAKNESYPHRVGQKKANPWGLHDMHGNVLEWCRDTYGPLSGGLEPLVTDGTHRVQRGGHWGSAGLGCGSSGRYMEPAELKKLEFGFRVALSFAK